MSPRPMPRVTGLQGEKKEAGHGDNGAELNGILSFSAQAC